MIAAADLWQKARELLAAFTHAFGAARKIALKWTMIDEDVLEALKALVPIEALARRLVFAEALTLKPKPPAPKRIAASKPKHISPFTLIPLDPLAFRNSLNPPPFVHLKPPHELELPPQDWRVRFTVARLAPRSAGILPAAAPRFESDPQRRRRCRLEAGATTGADMRVSGEVYFRSPGNPIHLAISRHERRALARADREHAEFWGYAKDLRKDAAPTWRLPQRISTDLLARRTEALRRVIEKPTRYARALARRMAKRTMTQIRRVTRRLRQRTDDLCQQAMDLIDAALPAFQDSS